MKISTAHKKFADRLNDQTALEYPELYLGPNWKDVLNFWLYLDTLSREDFRLLNKRYWALDEDARVFARDNAYKAAEATIVHEYGNVAWFVTPIYASSHATLELIGSHNLESLKFLPLFLTT